MLTKKELRERLLKAHEDACAEEGDYDSYAKAVELSLHDILGDLNLGDKWQLDLRRDENGYFAGVVVRPRSEDVEVPDIGDWEGNPNPPDKIDEAVDWWWRFAKTGKPPKE